MSLFRVLSNKNIFRLNSVIIRNLAFTSSYGDIDSKCKRYLLYFAGAGLVTGACFNEKNVFSFPTIKAARPIIDEGAAAGGDDGKIGKNFIADAVEKTVSAVVYIETQGRHPIHGNPITVSSGSGFIVAADGLIITNAHVVANKSRVKVKLYDGRLFDGFVEDIDPISDLATIRINCNNLHVIKLGNSSKVRPGEWVVAVGSPLSLSNTITAGVVSSINRGSHELGLHHKNMEYIQTDASINFGNSGGPLVNLDGEAIGINTMKVTAGISFAIPADYAREFLKRGQDKKAKGWFGRGGGESGPNRRRYMGITMLTLTPSIIQELQQRQPDFPSDVTQGVLVFKIVIGSPAYNGGLQPGDILVKINDAPITSATDVYRALETAQDLRVTVVRKHQTIILTVVPEVTE